MAKIAKWIFLTLIFSGVVICGYFAVTGYLRAAKPDMIAQEAFDYINEERAGEGLRELIWDDELAELALRHCEYMDETGNFEHSDLPYVENILDSWGALPGASAFDNSWQIVGEWIRSPQHCANLFDPDISQAAIGIKGNYATFLAR